MRVHFIGIGGIGVSALAKFYTFNGHQVSGSDDFKQSEIVKDLKKVGARVFLNYRASNVGRPDLVVYSAAIKADNPERRAALKNGIESLSYAEALGRLTKEYFTIAVSGSHGKSTTTALLSLILIKAGFDPTVIVGTKLTEFKEGNFRAGQSGYLIIEADEWNRSFHNYYPRVIILTNIDKEHLDTYKSFKGIVAGFARYIKNLSSDGFMVANWQDAAIRKISQKSPAQSVWYNRGRFQKHPLLIPGQHNQLNAEAAWTAAKKLGVKKSVANYVFSHYRGAWRRLEKLNGGVYTDYAHHPTEIKATLRALKEKYPKRELICIFQPHQQDRLNRLFGEFVGSFEDADRVVVVPLYKAKGREYGEGKNSSDLYEAVSKQKKADSVFYADKFGDIPKILKSFQKNAVIVFMSAGDLDNWARGHY